MWGIWQIKQQCWTSWDRFAVWKTKEAAEEKITELRKAHPGVQFEVREWK